jgi:tetratricopeptide (TPR) repeat protein
VLDLLQQAIAHQLAGRLAEAEPVYREVLSHDPDQPHALYLLGALRLAEGDADEAILLLRRAVRARPEHAEGKLTLANALVRAQQPAEAIPLYRALLAAHPAHVPARVNLARVLRAQGETKAAVALCREGVQINPDSAIMLEALASALLVDGDDRSAGAAAARALTLDSGRAESWFVHGTALSHLGQKLRAVASLTRAVAADPGHAEAALNLGNACLDLDRVAEAERWMRQAIACDPHLVEAHASLGFVLTGQGRLDEAVAACQTAIDIRPDFAVAHWNQSTAYLLAGDFAKGWPQYEWRKKHDRYSTAFRTFDGLCWVGENLQGKRLLVFAEQGLGDTIQFSRFIPLLAQMGAIVTLACDRRLHEVMRGLSGLSQVVERDGPLPPYDFWVDQMTLPLLLGITPESIPLANGYLAAEAHETAVWRARLGTGGIGLVWAGNPDHSNDSRRSLAFENFAPLLARGGRYVSLQAGPRAADAAGSFVRDLSPYLTNYARTAAIIAGLDLVITVDTSVCHLAGALGVPCWVLLPQAPDWRWILGRDDTPWYNSMRLFRQPHPGDWQEPISRIASALHRDSLAPGGARRARRAEGDAGDAGAVAAVPA